MAGGRDLKGITVSIGGDTTKLQSALAGVNKEVKNTQAQLKDVEKLLKLDPTNTELLSQKQKLLTQAISETKEKLTTLKTAAEQANEQLQKGEITQEQYDALQREIEETEQALKTLESQASSTNATLAKIEEVSGKFEQVGQSITSAGKTLTTHVTAPIVRLGTAAVKTAADFDEGMSKVAAISGATGHDLQDLRDKAREMGAKTKFSATEAASAFEYMAMAGWKSGDMISGIEGIQNGGWGCYGEDGCGRFLVIQNVLDAAVREAYFEKYGERKDSVDFYWLDDTVDEITLGEDTVEIRWKDGEVSTVAMEFIERRYVPSAYADFYNDFLDRIRSGEKKNKYKNLMGLGRIEEADE